MASSNYILFNEDGSIKKTDFANIINQNNDGVDYIFTNVEGITIGSGFGSTYSATAIFVLPDGTISEEEGEAVTDYEYEDDQLANGFLFELTQNETKLTGIVYATIQIKQISTNKVLYTYRVAITINKTASNVDLTLITLAQYNALKSYINSHFYKKSENGNFIIEDGFLQGNYFKAKNPSNDAYVDYTHYQIKISKPGEDPYYLLFPIKSAQTETNETLATREWAQRTIAPTKRTIGSFNTSSFALTEDGNYHLRDIPLNLNGGLIADSDLLIITWGNCFAICPIPQSGPGRVCAAMWNSNGEAQTIRVRYELHTNNTLLDISLQGGFIPPSNFTAYVINYKIA